MVLYTRGRGFPYKFDRRHPLGDCEVYFSSEIVEMTKKARHDLGESLVCIGSCGGNDLVRKSRVVAMARGLRGGGRDTHCGCLGVVDGVYLWGMLEVQVNDLKEDRDEGFLEYQSCYTRGRRQFEIDWLLAPV